MKGIYKYTDKKTEEVHGLKWLKFETEEKQ